MNDHAPASKAARVAMPPHWAGSHARQAVPAEGRCVQHMAVVVESALCRKDFSWQDKSWHCRLMHKHLVRSHKVLALDRPDMSGCCRTPLLYALNSYH